MKALAGAVLLAALVAQSLGMLIGELRAFA